MNFGKQLKDGIITQNPVLVQLLGLCSTLAITTSISNGLGMGVAVLIVLTCSNGYTNQGYLLRCDDCLFCERIDIIGIRLNR